jgi:hypothetical protein
MGDMLISFSFRAYSQMWVNLGNSGRNRLRANRYTRESLYCIGLDDDICNL